MYRLVFSITLILSVSICHISGQILDNEPLLAISQLFASETNPVISSTISDSQISKRFLEADETPINRRSDDTQIKYKKISIKSSSDSSSELFGAKQVHEKLPSTKPKSSPQSMVYKPQSGKSKGQSVTASVKPTVVHIRTTTAPATAPTTATTPRTRPWTQAKTTRQKETTTANPVEAVDSMVRPTKRSRINGQDPQQTKQTDNRQLQRTRAPDYTPTISTLKWAPPTTTTTTTAAPTRPRWRPRIRKPEGSRSNLFPDKTKIGKVNTSASRPDDDESQEGENFDEENIKENIVTSSESTESEQDTQTEESAPDSTNDKEKLVVVLYGDKSAESIETGVLEALSRFPAPDTTTRRNDEDSQTQETRERPRTQRPRITKKRPETVVQGQSEFSDFESKAPAPEQQENKEPAPFLPFRQITKEHEDFLRSLVADSIRRKEEKRREEEEERKKVVEKAQREEEEVRLRKTEQEKLVLDQEEARRQERDRLLREAAEQARVQFEERMRQEAEKRLRQEKLRKEAEEEEELRQRIKEAEEEISRKEAQEKTRREELLRRQQLEDKLRQEAEEEAYRQRLKQEEEEKEREEQARKELELLRRKQLEAKLRKEAEEEAYRQRLKQEEEERQKKEAEEQARKELELLRRKQLEVKLRKEAEEEAQRQRLMQEQEERERKEAEEQARKELELLRRKQLEAKLRKEAEEEAYRQRLKQEQEERERKEAEEQARKELELLRRKQLEAKLRKEAEEEAYRQRLKQEEEERERKEAQEQARKELELLRRKQLEAVRKEAEEEAQRQRLKQEEEERERKEAQEQARKEIELLRRKQLEAKLRKEAEEEAYRQRLKQEEEERERKEAEEQARKELELLRRQQLEEKLRKEAAEQEKKRHEEEKLKAEREERRRLEEFIKLREALQQEHQRTVISLTKDEDETRHAVKSSQVSQGHSLNSRFRVPVPESSHPGSDDEDLSVTVPPSNYGKRIPGGKKGSHHSHEDHRTHNPLPSDPLNSRPRDQLVSQPVRHYTPPEYEYYPPAHSGERFKDQVEGEPLGRKVPSETQKFAPKYPEVPSFSETLVKKPERVYTPPDKEYQPPSSYLDQDLPTPRVVPKPAQNNYPKYPVPPHYREKDQTAPPRTYEPPKYEYEPPTPAGSPYRPPSAEYQIPRTVPQYHTEERPCDKIPSSSKAADPYTRVVGVGQILPHLSPDQRDRLAASIRAEPLAKPVFRAAEQYRPQKLIETEIPSYVEKFDITPVGSLQDREKTREDSQRVQKTQEEPSRQSKQLRVSQRDETRSPSPSKSSRPVPDDPRNFRDHENQRQNRSLEIPPPPFEFVPKVPGFRLEDLVQQSSKEEPKTYVKDLRVLSQPKAPIAVNKDYIQHHTVVPGKPGVDYPNYETLPETAFNCETAPFPGYYADRQTRCQVFHVCQTNHARDSFLCPNGTIFNQKVRVCDWWYNVQCDSSPEFYYMNEFLYVS